MSLSKLLSEKQSFYLILILDELSCVRSDPGNNNVSKRIQKSFAGNGKVACV